MACHCIFCIKRMTREVIRQAMNQFLDDNINRLQRRKKGLPEQLRNEFVESTGYHITLNYLTDSVSRYRRAHDLTLINDANSWYARRSNSA
jgi:hypothetical protein